jgi:hypothetical protein
MGMILNHKNYFELGEPVNVVAQQGEGGYEDVI